MVQSCIDVLYILLMQTSIHWWGCNEDILHDSSGGRCFGHTHKTHAQKLDSFHAQVLQTQPRGEAGLPEERLCGHQEAQVVRELRLGRPRTLQTSLSVQNKGTARIKSSYYFGIFFQRPILLTLKKIPLFLSRKTFQCVVLPVSSSETFKLFSRNFLSLS